MPTNPPADAQRSPALRSRVTNGKALFAQGGDARGPWARRLRDLLALHLSDLGGADATSEAERSIVRRASVIEVELERLEAKFASGEAADRDLDMYQRAAGNLRRLLEATGLQRRSRDVTLTLQQYVAQKYGEPEADEAEVIEDTEREAPTDAQSGPPIRSQAEAARHTAPELTKPLLRLL